MAHLCDVLRHSAWLNNREHVLIRSGDDAQTVARFRAGVIRLASSLRRKLDLAVGCRVALLGVTTPEWMEILFACAWNGWICVLLNYRWSVKETLTAIRLTTPSVLFFDPDTADLSLQISEAFKITSIPINDQKSADHREQSIDYELPVRKAVDDSAVICFTSGTTGVPKGVTLSHRALCFQLVYKMAICGYSFEDVYLHTAPLFHVGGLVSALAMMSVGASQIFMKRFSAQEAASLIRKHSVSCFIAVPAMITDLAAHSQESVPFLSVKKILIGGGALNQQQALLAGMLFPNAHVCTAYGMTEACSSLTYSGPVSSVSLQQMHRNAGFPIPGTAIRVDPSSGEVLAKGPHLMNYYWNDQKSTSAAFDPNHWFKTGDVGYFNAQGALVLHGRLKEMIKSGGENIYPSEIESVLIQHPAIDEVIVVGVPDPRLGETLCVNFVLNNSFKWKSSNNHLELSFGPTKGEKDQTVTPQDLRDFCAESGLTRYKLPRIFIAQDTPLPRNSAGKLDRRSIQTQMCHIMAQRTPNASVSKL